MLRERVSRFVQENYELHEWRHASTILRYDFRNEWYDLNALLESFRFQREWIVTPGGRKSAIASWIDNFLYRRDWAEQSFETAFVVDGQQFDSPTHSVDCFRNRVGLEIEWNNKDPFFDRDLNNFRLLFDLRVLSVGIIITRSESLNALRRELRGEGFDAASTHMNKLLPKIEGGGAGGCPIIAIGLCRSLYNTP